MAIQILYSIVSSEDYKLIEENGFSKFTSEKNLLIFQSKYIADELAENLNLMGGDVLLKFTIDMTDIASYNNFKSETHYSIPSELIDGFNQLLVGNIEFVKLYN